MEQTLGKRIVEHRKRLGLTQDQLAERLGITAQAVSKWENDLSCPDIAMLPKLAEIFGISADELLGMEPQVKVHQAEVTDEDGEDADRGVFNLSFDSDADDGKWEFRWDSGRRNAVGFACWVLLMGGLLLADNILALNVGFWSLAWPSCLLMMGLFGSRRFSLTGLGFVLLGGYFLADNLGLIPFQLSGKIIWPALVILFGLSLLIDALRKPKKPRFSVKKGGNSSKTKANFHNTTDRFHCDLCFGEGVHRADLPVLAGGEANVSFGELTVDLQEVGTLAENCGIVANCSFGELVLLVPRRFAVQSENSTAFASIKFTGHPDSAPEGVILLEANASFGEIAVKYV